MHVCKPDDSEQFSRRLISFVPEHEHHANRKIRIMQWNILAQGFVPLDEFVHCPLKYLSIDRRCSLIVNEIIRFAPDFVCLQEADIIVLIIKELNQRSVQCAYDYIFLPKTNSPCLQIQNNYGPDGLSIIYCKDKFDLKQSIQIPLDDQSTREALFCQFVIKQNDHSSSACGINLICVHLKAKSEFVQVRLNQGRNLLNYLDAYFKSQVEQHPSPTIICGDFNADPWEPVIKLMTDFKFQTYPHLQLVSSHCTSKPDEIQCTALDNTSNSDEASVSAALVQREPMFTTWKCRQSARFNRLTEECRTIDYIWHFKQLTLVKSIWSLPSKCQIGCGGLPTPLFPSDHINLVADFAFV